MNKNKIFVLATSAVLIGFFGGRAYFERNATEQNASPAVKAETSALVRDHSPIQGDKNAPITIVEFLDPECESCRSMHEVTEKLLKEYEGKIRIVIRYLPLHPNSAYAAAGIEEARELGKFDQALDLFFEKQPLWGDHHAPKPELLATYLVELGVAKDKTSEAYLVAKHKTKLALDFQDAQTLQLQQTPSFFVNGRLLARIGYENLKIEIEKELTTMAQK